MNEPIRSYTSHNLQVIHWSQTLVEASSLMQTHRIRHLPVVDDQHRIVGIISDRDLRNREDKMEVVRDRMHFEVAGIDEAAHVSAAAEQMVAQKISSLLVLRADRVVGILTSDDLLRVLTEEHKNFVQKIAENLTAKVESQIYRSPIGAILNQISNAGL